MNDTGISCIVGVLALVGALFGLVAVVRLKGFVGKGF